MRWSRRPPQARCVLRLCAVHDPSTGRERGVEVGHPELVVPHGRFRRSRTLDRLHSRAELLGLNGLRVGEACSTNIEDLALERGHRTLRIIGKGNKPRSSRSSREPPGRSTSRSANVTEDRSFDAQTATPRAARTAHRWVAAIAKRAALGSVYPHMLRSAFIMAALDAGVPLRDVQIAARHADPRTTTIYDRRRENFDRHAAYVVVAYFAGG
jgi:integrase/recombinase XerD